MDLDDTIYPQRCFDDQIIAMALSHLSREYDCLNNLKHKLLAALQDRRALDRINRFLFQQIFSEFFVESEICLRFLSLYKHYSVVGKPSIFACKDAISYMNQHRHQYSMVLVTNGPFMQQLNKLCFSIYHITLIKL